MNHQQSMSQVGQAGAELLGELQHLRLDSALDREINAENV